jgi:uncharacterized lipoprotein NlpE involved in copper resistance
MINLDKIKSYTKLNNKNSFTRKRKMPLKDIILCTIDQKGLTTEMKLNKYFLEKGVTPMSISKQYFLQQRKKLNPISILIYK